MLQHTPTPVKSLDIYTMANFDNDLLLKRERAFTKYERYLLSTDPYPVDADILLGLYSQKHVLKECLQREFAEDVDYIQKPDNTARKGRGGHNRKNIFLSVPCFKEVLMMQRTVEGKKFRRYFILAEEYLRLKLISAPTESVRSLLSDHRSYDDLLDSGKVMTTNDEESESHYQTLLESHVGESALLTRQNTFGQTDIHTSTTIYEVKRWSNYKHALGQLLAYNVDVKKALVVVLFGLIPDESQQAKICRLFKLYDVTVMYFDDKDVLHTLV